jgi:hypothetical protein
MTFLNGGVAISKFFFFLGLGAASFALFLHPMDPIDFVTQAFVSPQETFHVIYGKVQSIAFWISAAFMLAGVLGMLLVAVQRRRARHFFAQMKAQHLPADAGEENWMFL